MANQFTPTELKTILFSKRANIYYLEKCRVMQKDGRVLYLTEGRKSNQTPLFAGTEIEWLNPQSEYRPTEYVQGWLSFWFDDSKRLMAAKNLQRKRCEFLERVWGKDVELQDEGFYCDDQEIESALAGYQRKINDVKTVQELLSAEAHFAKQLYKYAAEHTDQCDFVRDVEASDYANIYLNHGNYLAYGMAASTLWVLGIPHGFALMHGKTRRGALVFDIADLIKDTLVLPWAFICAGKGMSDRDFRIKCLEKFAEHKALDYMFDNVKKQSQIWHRGGENDDGDICQQK